MDGPKRGHEPISITSERGGLPRREFLRRLGAAGATGAEPYTAAKFRVVSGGTELEVLALPG